MKEADVMKKKNVLNLVKWRYWGIKCGEGILFEDRTKGLLAQAIFFALFSIFYIYW